MIARGIRAEQAYSFIEAYHAKNGVMPTVREIASAMGVSSSSRAHGYIDNLVARGKLQRIPGKVRNIAFVKSVCCPNCQHNFDAAVGR